MDDLIAQVKRKLNITWDDEDTDARVADITKSAAQHMRFMLGIQDEQFDFAKPGIENELFLAYCFYEWNHSIDVFNESYRPLIMSARTKYEVEQYKEDDADAAAD